MQNEYLKEIFSKVGMTITEEQCHEFVRYEEMLVETNKVMNLTAITEFDQVAVKHFVDSCMLFAPAMDKAREIAGVQAEASLIDVGTGAGFPGLPLKILKPELNVMLLDSLDKRIGFLNDVITSLDLQKVETIHARAEDGARSELREAYDIAVSRAVANMSVLLEYTLPYVKVGGCFVSYKSGDVDEELKNAENALKILGGSVVSVEKFELPEDGGLRSLVFIKKVAETPSKYPRKAGKPTKNPL